MSGVKAAGGEPTAEARGRVLFAIAAPFQAFLRLEAAGGLIMIACAAIALVWANSPLRDVYDAIFHATLEIKVAGVGIQWTIHDFTNDALMTLFFAVAGMQIKRELVRGELSAWRRAALPLIAAAGGMLVPAIIYTAFNPAGPARAGWAVPVATDIAFALGCLSLVARRVPPSIVVFLTALAIFDDLGAILVIALFYGGAIDAPMLSLAVVLTMLLFGMGRSGIQSLWLYAIVGVVLWIVVLQAGIHPTLAGVVIGLALPTAPRRPARELLEDLELAVTSLRRDCEAEGRAPDGTIAAIERHLESVQSPLDRALHGLHGFVVFAIVPLFALANAGVTLTGDVVLGSSVTLGVLVGLTVGKPIGVLGAIVASIRLGIAPRPTGATWSQLAGMGILAGIGFTMSLFIGNLGLGAVRALEDQAKLGVLTASTVSAVLGLLVIRLTSGVVARPAMATRPVVLDVPRFARGYTVQPCPVAGPLLAQTVKELDVRRQFGVIILGVWRAGDEPAHSRRLEPVDPDRLLADGEVLLVAGQDQAVATFVDFARPPAAPDA